MTDRKSIRGFYLWIVFSLLGCVPSLAGAVTLTLYSATDRAAIQPVIEAFNRKYPGIVVRYEEFQSNTLYRVLAGEADDPTPGQPQPDLIISSAMDLQTKLVNDGQAQPYQSEYTDSLPDWANWRNEAFGFTFEPVVFAYRKDLFVDQPLPDSHERLTELLRSNSKFYSNRIGTYNVNISGVGYLFATQDAIRSSLNGRLLESLGRVHAKTYCCTDDILRDLTDGKLVLGYNLLGSYALARIREHPELGVLLPKDYTLVMSRVAFIHKLAKEPGWAGVFLDFLLSPEAQNIMASQSGLVPLRTDAEGTYSRAAIDEKYSTSYQPIGLKPTLLVYLDRLKRARFLKEWRDAIFFDEAL
ncbi:ABC transporter substrate-binding protein [Hahella sp. CCB-MM4]|uniref:ABC transporter substrate-binding protein n=1 Tax=Hahella sp. (strain CCB-MM4) TaxID=1926491 RepID=UPI00143D5AA6|nr:ABC transporter substrate-binding protein [Hahella sp. CCB-MM4]